MNIGTLDKIILLRSDYMTGDVKSITLLFVGVGLYVIAQKFKRR